MTFRQSGTGAFFEELIPDRSTRFTLIAGFWLLVGFLSSLHWWYIYVYPDPYDNFWQVLRVKVVVWWGWGLITPVLILCGNRFRITKQNWISRVSLLLSLSLIVTILYSLFYAVALLVNLSQPVWGADLENMSKFVLSMHSTFFFLAAIATIVMEQGFLFLRDLRERELRASQLESQLAVAQWQNLRSQLNPHFLFNVLNTSASQLLSGKQDVAHTTLVKLSELLRLSLEQTEHQYTTLSNEVQFARRYLELVQARFPDRLKVIIAVDPETMRASVPTLLLQPLVENAVKYGISESTTECAVHLRAFRENSQLILQVSNTGDPIAHASSNGTGVGLKNLRERLQYLYRDVASVSLSVSPDGGADVRVELPFSETNE